MKMQEKIEISPCPILPEEIKIASKCKKLVIFIGAGVSRLVGCKRWHSLAEDLLKICFDNGFINYKDLEELKKETDNKKLISIARHILKNSDKEEMFFNEFEKALTGDVKTQCEIYKYIADIGTFFITTNADKKFHYTQKRNFFKIEDLKSGNCQENTLFHLHGCIDDRNSLVFTVKEYFRRYQNKDFQEFLNHIFNKYTVLFLGYGLSEFEVLDFIMQRHNKGQKQDPRHYILLPYMKGQEVIALWHQHYYADMDIKVIPYDYTEKGYEQLVNVLKEWSWQNLKLTLQIQDLETILEKMPNPNIKEVNNVINLLRGKEYENLFWQKIPQYPQQSIALFDALLKEGCFKVGNLPPRKENTDGSYSFVYWEKANYLIAITQYLITMNDKEHLIKIKEIIDNYIHTRPKPPIPYIDELFMRLIVLLTPLETIIDKELKSTCFDFIANVIQSENWFSHAACDDYFNVICKIDDKALLGNFLEIVLQGRKGGPYHYVSCVEAYYVTDFLEKNSEKIIEKMNVFDIQKIILQIEKAEGCYIEYISLESNNEDSSHDKYVQSILFFIRDVLFKKATPKEGLEILEQMLKSKSQAIQRMAIFIIAKRYDDFNELFWEVKENPFNLKYQSRMELYTLLVGNKGKLSTESFEIIANWIEKSSGLKEEEKSHGTKYSLIILY